jgi:hypothetical protein
MSPWGLAGMVIVLVLSIGILARRHWEDQHPEQIVNCVQTISRHLDSTGAYPVVTKCYSERR